LNVRHAIALLVALGPAAGCTGSSDPTPIDLPVAPMSAITVATAATSYQGSVPTSIVAKVPRCGAAGVGVLAETADAGVTAVFARWPAAGDVYDLALPGADDSVIVSSQIGRATYCTDGVGASAGTVQVLRFEQVGSRFLVDVVLTGVVAGPTTIDAHLYH
jgi:hypothetical protein